MRRKEYLFMKLTEECAEVAQRACKQSLFGRNEIQKGQAQTNAERLRFETNDLLTVVRMLEDEGHLPRVSRRRLATHMLGKMRKIEKYWRYAKKLKARRRQR